MASRTTAQGEGTSLHDRRRRAGHQLAIGLHGHDVTDDLRALCAELTPGAFVLFGRNLVESGQTAELCRALRELGDPHLPPMIFLDHEGGSVLRTRAFGTAWPSAREVCEAQLSAEVAAAMADELRALGVDSGLGPVADLDLGPEANGIGDRAASDDPARAAAHVAATVGALQAGRVLAVLKHFPGHGAAITDTHDQLASLDIDEGTLRAREWAPFAAGIAAGAGGVMVGHLVAPGTGGAPASLAEHSARALRDELGFDGVLFTDDLEMGALAAQGDDGELARRATRAGADQLLVCHTPARQLAIFEGLIHAQERDPGHDRAARISGARLLALRERLWLPPAPRPALDVVGSDAHRALRDQVLRRARGQA